MAVVTFMSYDGDEHEAPLEEGSSLMQVATNNAIPGIDADCGGEAACGTCHVILERSAFESSGSIGDDEELMLDMTPEREETSRLACVGCISRGTTVVWAHHRR